MKRTIFSFILLLSIIFNTCNVTSIVVNAETIVDTAVITDAEEETVESVDFTNIHDTTLVKKSPANVNASSFDPRDYGLVSSVKDQGSEGLCWDFAANAMAESNLILQGESNTIDLSEIFYAYDTYNRTYDGTFDSFCNAGYNSEATWDNTKDEFKNHFALESKYPYPSDISTYSLTASQLEDYDYKVVRQYKFSERATYDRTEIKEMIACYGGITAGYTASSRYTNVYGKSTTTTEELTSTTIDTNYYCPTKYQINHSVEVVGWDDNYSASNFAYTPEGDGAWLCKNSWGTGNGVGSGYFWLSYYDKTLGFCGALSIAKKSSTGFVTYKSYDMTVGSSLNLNNDIVYDVDTVSYSCKNASNTSNYSVSITDGLLTATGLGTTTVSAYDSYSNKLAVFTINVKAADTKLVTNISTQTVETDTLSSLSDKLSVTLDGVALTLKDTKITSSDTSVAKVNGTYGQVYLKGYGTTTITVSYTDDVITDGKTLTGSFTLTVKKKTPEEVTTEETPITEASVTTESGTVNNTVTTTDITNQTQSTVITTPTLVPTLPTNTVITNPTTNTTTNTNTSGTKTTTTTKTTTNQDKTTNHTASNTVINYVLDNVKYKVDTKTKEVTVTGVATQSIANITIRNKVAGYSVTKIAKNAFKGKKITKITVKATKLKSIGKDALKVKNVKQLKLNVPKSKKKTYQKMVEKSTKGISL